MLEHQRAQYTPKGDSDDQEDKKKEKKEFPEGAYTRHVKRIPFQPGE